MSTSDWLGELLTRYLEAEEKGETISLTEEFRNCPELRPEFDRLLQGYRHHEAWERSQPAKRESLPDSLRLEPGAEPIKGYRLVELLGRRRVRQGLEG